MAPGAGRPARPVDLDHPAHPPRRRPPRAEPRKRPRSSWIRFEASAPNEVWQSDFTHWRLADGSEVEICSWLDDHARYLLACTAFRRVGGDDVVATFTATGDAHGWPAATLTELITGVADDATQDMAGEEGFEPSIS